MNYIKIKNDDKTHKMLAALAKESSTAYVLMMFICLNANVTDTKYFMSYISKQAMADYLGKSHECVRKCLVLLREMGFIETDLVKNGSDLLAVEAKLNRY